MKYIYINYNILMNNISNNINTIQSNEELISNSLSNPNKLLFKVRSLTNENKYDDGLDLLDKAIILKIDKVNKNKEDKSLIPLYLEYAQVLITKQFNSQDLFGDVKNDDIDNNDNDIHNDDNENNNIHEHNKEENKDDDIHNDYDDNKYDEDNSEDSEQEEYNDQELAYDYLFTCQKIINTEINILKENKDKQTDSNLELKELNNQLSEVYLLFAQLELLKSDNKKAISFFEKGLEVRKINDDKFSRAIADIYYQMSIAYDYDIMKCFTCLYKVKIIMEYHLQKLIDKSYFISKPVFYNIIEEDLLDKELIKDYKSIKVNSDDVEIKDSDNDDIAEIKSILIEVYLKIDDTIEGIETQKEYMLAVQKEKDKKEKEANDQKGEFNSMYDESKLINANCLLKKKRVKAGDDCENKLRKDEKKILNNNGCVELNEGELI